MSMSDPIASCLTVIRNGSKSRLDKVEVPASRLKANLIKVLREEGFIRGFTLVKEGTRALISIQLKYDSSGDSVIKGIVRRSRPGLRKYTSKERLSESGKNSNIVILSTSKGVMSARAALNSGVGGEVLCEVW